MIYTTSLDKLAKNITVAVSVLFGVIIIGQLLLIPGEGLIVVVITSLLLLSIYFGDFLFRPLDYYLTSEKLVIHRPLRNIEIERKEIRSVEMLEQDKLKWTVRTFGVGGLFGYWGQFTNSKIGNMTWYATRRNNAVLIITISNQKILLTPDSPEQFIAEFNL